MTLRQARPFDSSQGPNLLNRPPVYWSERFRWLTYLIRCDNTRDKQATWINYTKRTCGSFLGGRRKN